MRYVAATKYFSKERTLRRMHSKRLTNTPVRQGGVCVEVSGWCVLKVALILQVKVLSG